MEIKLISDDELHIITFQHLNKSYIIFNNERFDLVTVQTDRDTKKITSMFIKNY